MQPWTIGLGMLFVLFLVLHVAFGKRGKKVPPVTNLGVDEHVSHNVERLRELRMQRMGVVPIFKKAGEQSPYPTPECLQPYEVHMFAHDEQFQMSAGHFLKRLAHVVTCDFCFILVGNYLPKELQLLPPKNNTTP